MSSRRWNKDKLVIGVALKHTQSVEQFPTEDLENLNEEKIAVLTQNFAEFLLRNMRRGNTCGKPKQANQGGNSNQLPPTVSQKSFKENEKKNNNIQCQECEGFGHIQAKCANILKKKGKATIETPSDGEEVDHISNLVAFIANSQTQEDIVSESEMYEESDFDHDEQQKGLSINV
ncbi:Zinc finger, CCHC-type [Trema orientale]|uniref:Zinc finger, CCHC-type n=1 Tax=Trema orientale TaxID=63057 RepID=A0A2P5FLR2_TREOI|nr:Zinc finger, CCHC-type [Trema orientale]